MQRILDLLRPALVGTMAAAALATPAAAVTVVGHGLTVSQDGLLVFDSRQGLTWLRDTNYAYNNGQVPAGRDLSTWDGRMTWDEATSWAHDLTVVSGGVGYTDWRLPTRAEMAYLYQTQFVRINDPGPFTVARFTSLAFGDAWSKDEDSATRAYYMDMQDFFSAGGFAEEKAYNALTWGAVMVPEPRTYALMLGGLSLVGWAARRRKAA